MTTTMEREIENQLEIWFDELFSTKWIKKEEEPKIREILRMQKVDLPERIAEKLLASQKELEVEIKKQNHIIEEFDIITTRWAKKIASLEAEISDLHKGLVEALEREEKQKRRIASLEAENEKLKDSDMRFHDHIKTHLNPEESVWCTICHKTYSEIVGKKPEPHITREEAGGIAEKINKLKLYAKCKGGMVFAGNDESGEISVLKEDLDEMLGFLWDLTEAFKQKGVKIEDTNDPCKFYEGKQPVKPYHKKYKKSVTEEGKL